MSAPSPSSRAASPERTSPSPTNTASTNTERGRGFAAALLCLPAALLWLELVFKAFHSGFTAAGLFFTALFSLARAFCSAFWPALGGRAAFFRAATAVVPGLLALFFGIHAVYHDIFSEYLSVGMLGVAGGALTGYWREALRGIVRCLPEILLMLAPFVLWLVFGKRLAPEGLRGRRKLLPLLLFLALQLAASAGVRLCTGGAVPLSLSYGEGFVMDTGVANFGLLTAQRIDARPDPGGRRAPARGPGRAPRQPRSRRPRLYPRRPPLPRPHPRSSPPSRRCLT